LDESGEWQCAVTSCGTGSDGLAVGRRRYGGANLRLQAATPIGSPR
jgi:hypothetical protein